jgi:hypothetical protein
VIDPRELLTRLSSEALSRLLTVLKAAKMATNLAEGVLMGEVQRRQEQAHLELAQRAANAEKRLLLAQTIAEARPGWDEITLSNAEPSLVAVRNLRLSFEANLRRTVRETKEVLNGANHQPAPEP